VCEVSVTQPSAERILSAAIAIWLQS